MTIFSRLDARPNGAPLLPPIEITAVRKMLSDQVDWGLELVNVREAWKVTEGERIKIGILDTGLPDHRELHARGAWGPSYWPIDDLNGHSTFCGGIISAAADGSGVVGIAPKAEIFYAKALDASGRGTDESISYGVERLLDANVDVINISLGAPYRARDGFPRSRNVLLEAHQAGVVLVAAAGNDGSRVNFPACLDWVIGIGAINSAKEWASFSSSGSSLEFVMPGVDIYSTWLGQSYLRASGTSFAAPHATGIIALILADHWREGAQKATPIARGSSQTTEDVRSHLRMMAEDLGANGWDSKTGSGLIRWNPEDRALNPSGSSRLGPLARLWAWITGG